MQEELLLFLCTHCNAFAIMTAVVFRAQIKTLWRKVVLFADSVWSTFWSLTFLLVSSGLARMSAAGVRGGFYLSNYASAHFVPVVCLMILLFAFMVAGVLFIYYFPQRTHLKKYSFVKTNVFLRLKSLCAAIVKPRFVLLQ